MRTFAHKPKATQQTKAAKSTKAGRAFSGQSHDVDSILHLQRTIGNQAVQQLLQTNAEELQVNSVAPASPRFAHDFSGIPLFLQALTRIQPKLKVNTPGDLYEQEADRVANLVVGPRLTGCGSLALSPVAPAATGGVGAEQVFNPGVGSGRVLGVSERAFFEPRLGHDLSQVRVHSDADAAQMSQRLGARAFACGHDLYFAPGQYDPHSDEGRRLLAHELSHVVQQVARSGLIQRAPSTAAERAEAEKQRKLKSALISDYALAGVVDGNGSWNSAELEQVTDAFKLLPARDKKALKGVTLSRVTRLGSNTAGRFKSKQGVTGTTVVNEATLELADLAFKDGAPKSYTLIMHEVGHTVASLPHRTALQAEHLATAEFNRLVDVENAAVKAFNDAVEACDKTVDPLNDAVKEYSEARKSGDKDRIAAAKTAYNTRKKEYDTKKAEENRLKAILKKAQKQSNKAEKTMKKKGQTAQKARISAKDLARIKKRAVGAAGTHKKSFDLANKKVETLSDEDKTQSVAYVSAIKAASTMIEDFATKTKDQTVPEDDVELLIADVQRKIDDRDKQKKDLTGNNKDNPALSTYASVERDQDDWFEAAKAHSLAHNRKARVQKFVNFVELKHINPITPYAADNWPHKPEEFYAETFSMYLANPNNLKTVSKALYDWFKANK